MEFAVLGPLEVRTAAGAVSVRRGLPRTLVVALLLRPSETVSSDYLMDVLWDDTIPRNPANALQTQISYVRKTLGNAEPNGASVLETRAGGYSLVVERDRIDAYCFESAATRGAEIDTLKTASTLTAALEEIDAALALWRGEAFEDVAGMDFARGEATRLEELRWAASERRIDLLLRLGRHVAAVGDLAQLVERMPLRERFHEQLVLALYRSGRQTEALRAYDDARRMLADDLGLDPGPDLRELQVSVLQQDPSLVWTPPDPGPPPDAAAAGGTPVEPTAQSSSGGRLPVPVSRLIGRERLLVRLHDLLEHHRALTLTGPAGAGKTRLAIDLSGRQERPVWYVDLSPIDDPALVAPTVAAAAGVTVAPCDDLVRATADAVASQRALLVLDTCEHVVAAVAELASAVLRAAPDVHMLATSRRPLGLSGEFAWPVPPLDLPPSNATSATDITSHSAVALFIERATAVHPDLEVDDAVATDIAAVCHALDGLPLAIELAAARTDVLSPAAIRARLEDRFNLLIDGGTDVAERQQTLRAAIDWSFDLLTSDQRTMFTRLGTFAGTFDLDAALTVAGSGLAAPFELLAALVKQSMVARAGQERYRLLDTLRAYALEVLADLDADDTRERHAAFYVEKAEQGEAGIRGQEQLGWLEQFRNDINNFRAALEWSMLTGNVERAAREAGALAWFWTLNGMLTEAMQQLEQLVGFEDVPAATRSKCLWGYGLLAASLGRLEVAREAGYLSAELARSCGDRATTAYGLNAAAVAEWALGKHDESLAAHGEAVQLLQEIDDPWGLAVCKVLQARTQFDRRDPDAAATAREAVENARRAGDLHVLGLALTQIAQMAVADRDHDSALVAAEEALGLQEQIGYTEGMVSALHVLGQAHRVGGDRETARRVHQRALSLASRIGHVAAICEAMEDLARTDAVERPAFAHMLLRAARVERSARTLPLRPRDADELSRLERQLASTSEGRLTDRPFTSLVSELAE